MSHVWGENTNDESTALNKLWCGDAHYSERDLITKFKNIQHNSLSERTRKSSVNAPWFFLVLFSQHDSPNSLKDQSLSGANANFALHTL